MTSFALCSDMHLDFDRYELPDEPVADILLVAGDVVEAVAFTKASGPKIESRINAIEFFDKAASQYQKVIYVAGNHEHYNGKFQQTIDMLRNALPKVTVLDNETVELPDVKIVGGTMWTDLNGNCPMTSYHLQSVMNDYHKITWADAKNSLYRKLRPSDTYNEHCMFKNYLSMVHDQTEKPLLVMTHHAPSHLSIAPQYTYDSYMNGGFVSEMSFFVEDHPRIKCWVHGHTHSNFDYQLYQTRVMCNPRGYSGYEQIANTFQLKVFTVE